MWNLLRAPDSERLVSLAELRDDAACLHRGGGESLVDQARLRDDAAIGFGLLKDLINVVGWWMHAEGDVGAELLVQERRAWLHGFLYINNSGQRLIIDLDQIEGIARDIGSFRDHGGHRIAVEAHLALGKRAAASHPFGNVPQRHSDSDIAHLPLQVVGCINSNHAGKFAGRICLDAVNAGLTVGATQHRHMEHAEEFDIINVCCLARNESGVFTPLDGRADHSCNTHKYACPFSVDEKRNESSKNVGLAASMQAEINRRRSQARFCRCASVRRQTGRRSQYSDSRCSDRCCLRDLCESQLRSGWGYA